MPPPLSPKLSQTQWFDYALLGLLAILWSSSFVFIKIGVATLPPATLTAGRLALGALILFVFSQYRGHQIPFNLKAWRLFFFVGFFGNALPFTLIGWGGAVCGQWLGGPVYGHHAGDDSRFGSFLGRG